MKKIQTIYQLTDKIWLVQNEEYKEHINLIEFGEPCSGILKHWGSVEETINELEHIIGGLKLYKKYET